MNSKDGFIWSELTNLKYKNPHPQPITASHFDQILGDCAAVTDMPCCAFWSELMDAYPSAKIVLVDRDIEAWYKSFEVVVIEGVFKSWRTKVLLFCSRIGLLPVFVNQFIFELYPKYFQADMERNAKRVYGEHYRDISKKAEDQGRKVLRMRIEDARWETLCGFLGKDVPEGTKEGERLPKGNEREVTAARTRKYQMLALGLVVVKLVAFTGIPVAAAYWYMRWKR